MNKGFQKLLDKFSHIIDDYSIENDGYGNEYWIYLKHGLIAAGTETGSICETTLKDLERELKSAKEGEEY